MSCRRQEVGFKNAAKTRERHVRDCEHYTQIQTHCFQGRPGNESKYGMEKGRVLKKHIISWTVLGKSRTSKNCPNWSQYKTFEFRAQKSIKQSKLCKTDFTQ